MEILSEFTDRYKGEIWTDKGEALISANEECNSSSSDGYDSVDTEM